MEHENRKPGAGYRSFLFITLTLILLASLLLPAPGWVFVALIMAPATLMAVHLVKSKSYFTLVSVLSMLLLFMLR